MSKPIWWVSWGLTRRDGVQVLHEMQGGVVVASMPQSERGEEDLEGCGASATGGGGSGRGAWRKPKEELRVPSSEYTVWRAATSRWMQR